MRRDLQSYIVILALATAVQYALELQLAGFLRMYSWPMVPWIVSAALYGALGASAWLALAQRSVVLRFLLVAFLAGVPHLMFEITHGSDPAYPYIGLLFIVPDLIAAAIGAGLAAAVRSKTSTSKGS